MKEIQLHYENEKTEIAGRCCVITEAIKSQSGWIFLDSLMGTIILSVAILAILLTINMALRGTSVATEKTQAIYIAQQTLDSFKKSDGKQTIDITTPSSKVKQGNTEYSVAVASQSIDEVKDYKGNANKYNLATYKVTVGWPYDEDGNESNKVSMVGYYYVSP